MATNNSETNLNQRPRERNQPPPRRNPQGRQLQWRQQRQQQPPSPQLQQPQQQGVVGLAEKRKPVFVKVDQLKPGTNGHTLTVKVVNQTTVLEKGGAASSHLRQTRIAECLIGDETGTILFTARNDQVDVMKVGATVNLRNAKIDMFKGSMRLAVDKWGRIEVTEPATFDVKEDNNLSLVEYELVNVVEE